MPIYTYDLFPWGSGLIRINQTRPFMCRERRLNWAVPNETGKTEVPCHNSCGTIKILPCSKVLSAEHRPKFWSPSPAMVTSPYKWQILERDVKPSIINQAITYGFFGVSVITRRRNNEHVVYIDKDMLKDQIYFNLLLWYIFNLQKKKTMWVT
jgi:hypothetical protein